MRFFDVHVVLDHFNVIVMLVKLDDLNWQQSQIKNILFCQSATFNEKVKHR